MVNETKLNFLFLFYVRKLFFYSWSYGKKRFYHFSKTAPMIFLKLGQHLHNNTF